MSRAVATECAKLHGGKCVSKLYKNKRSKLLWRCINGHQWRATLRNIEAGTWCKKCKKDGILKKCISDAGLRKGHCLSNRYINSNTKMLWRCHNNHKWEAAYAKIKSGTWCPKCILIGVSDCKLLAEKNNGICISNAFRTNSLVKWRCSHGHIFKKTYAAAKLIWCIHCNRNKVIKNKNIEAHEFVKKKGGKLIGKINKVTERTVWECFIGHQWITTFDSIKRGSWCNICVSDSTYNKMCASSTLKAKKIAKEKGGTCVPKSNMPREGKLLCECKSGHKWETKYSNIIRGCWCPNCAGNIKHSISVFKECAKKQSGECISNEYVNFHTHLTWKCGRGHIWKASPASVYSQGTWCPYCSKKAKHSINDCVRLAGNYNGFCLSDKYINAKSKLKWRCSKGHMWEATYDDVNHDYWCSVCGRGKAQRKLYNIIDEIYVGYEVCNNFRGFDWLKTRAGGKQEIDIFVKGVGLAIEYHGVQHYKPIVFFGGEENLKYTKRLDKNKAAKIKYHSSDVKKFIIFNYKEKNKINKNYVSNKLIESGVFVP